jgi:uncharacterized protein
MDFNECFNLQGINTKLINEYVENHMKNYNSPSHDFSHIKRVVLNATKIYKKEIQKLNGINIDYKWVYLGAYYHDALDSKFNNENDKVDGKIQLYKHWEEIGLKKEEGDFDRLLNIIENVSWSKELKMSFSEKAKIFNNNPELCVIVDADRIDSLDFVGIMRTFSYGGEKNRSLSETLNHFKEKLLLIKDHAKTETGKELLIEGHKVLENFYNLAKINLE